MCFRVSALGRCRTDREEQAAWRFGRRDMPMVSPEVRFLEHTLSIFVESGLLIGVELRVDRFGIGAVSGSY